MLQINNLSKMYEKGKYAVKDVSLTINSGEIFGFIGHNGAGKTTTIKCVVGILEYDEGKILIDGVDIKSDPLLCKKITQYIPDNPDLYEGLTGIQYLNFISDIYKVSKSIRTEKIEKYCNLFNIYKDLNNQIVTYSHGMKQKLAIVSALITSPKLLVLDEPFVGLDPKAAYEVKQIMKEMCSEGCSIFFSTHVLEVAEKLCDKVAIIKEGKIIVQGTTSEVIGNKGLEEVFLEHANE